jgi:TetR/AcrR family transcriptional regulator
LKYISIIKAVFAMSPRTKAQFQEMQDKARERILDTGLLLFARKGVSATGVTEIAREAGISLGLLYHYYTSKEELFATLVNMALKGAIDALASCEQNEASASEQINRISEMISKTLKRDEKTAYYFLLLLQAGYASNALSVSLRPAIDVVSIGALFDHLEKLIQTGQAQGTVKAGDPRQLAQLYWAAFHGLCLYKITMRRFAPPETELLNGILLEKDTRANENQ